ncbi:MAG: membrane protein insertion efficiency factor YidD [Bacteroidetes bacterium]|nr:membrane protein insertion efficiency factor YidD [Bacteroidota bacterium]
MSLPRVGQAQSVEGDLALLNNSQAVQSPTPTSKNTGWNPMKRAYLFGIHVYQRVISEQLATNCAFELTCSRFSKAMVNRYGFVKGYFLSFDRLSRCNAISPLETFPVRLDAQHKILESPADFSFR